MVDLESQIQLIDWGGPNVPMRVEGRLEEVVMKPAA